MLVGCASPIFLDEALSCLYVYKDPPQSDFGAIPTLTIYDKAVFTGNWIYIDGGEIADDNGKYDRGM